MADEFLDQIQKDATAPASASGDTGSMSAHPLPDKVFVDRYCRQTKAKRGGVHFSKLVPGSASGVERGGR